MHSDGKRLEGPEFVQKCGGEEMRLTDLLTELIHHSSELAAAPTVDDLCRQAVLTGLGRFGFERMSIWLVDSEHKLIRGMYGTDENGSIRDERGLSHSWSDTMAELELLQHPHLVLQRKQVPLYNDAKEVVGLGEAGAAALWNGETVIGMLYMDNLITQRSIGEELWRIFELFASTLGHLISLKLTESALRSKEELLSQILDIMPVGVFVLAAEEKITRYNRAAQEIWEFEPDSIGDWSPSATWVHDRRSVEKGEWAGRQAIVKGESVLNQVVEIVRTDGTRRVLLNSGVPLRDASGALTGAVVVNQDITDSMRREQQLGALAHMGQVLRPLTGRRGVQTAVVEHLVQLLFARGVAVVMADKEGRLTFEAAAGEFVPMQGMTVPEELSTPEARMDTEIRVHDLDSARADCIFKELPHKPRYLVTAPLITERSAIGAVVLGYTDTPDSSALSLIGALAEVSAAAIQRGQLYDEVMTQANRLDRVMEAVNFGLLLLDPQRRVVLANQHAQVSVGHLADVAIGEELTTLGGQPLSRYLTLPGAQSRTQEVASDGAIHEITTVPVGATGDEGGWLIMIHDVTRERGIQSSIQQHQRLAAVGQLAAGIAHDFNNIIAVIMLYVQMLERNPLLNETDHNRLHVIRDQSLNASKLIRQILDFSRQTVIERQPVDLKAVIQESIAFWGRTLPETIAFHVETDVEGPAQVLAEASSIKQALTNLALNARDAMPNGGKLRVALRALVVGDDGAAPVAGLRRGNWYEIDVSDTGVGISPQNLPHIFDPFFTTKDIGKGTGLGLAQVYGILQQHDGFVTAQSEVGKGTTICIFLPALIVGSSADPENENQEIAAEGTETILLVEDNGPAREATMALLEMMGYRVLVAADGRAGYALFERHRDAIQLVLSDLVMPEMGGLELYRRIHEENPNISVLIMTGYPLGDENREATESGMIDWLQKPFTVKQLTAAVRRVLERTQIASDH